MITTKFEIQYDKDLHIFFEKIEGKTKTRMINDVIQILIENSPFKEKFAFDKMVNGNITIKMLDEIPVQTFIKPKRPVCQKTYKLCQYSIDNNEIYNINYKLIGYDRESLDEVVIDPYYVFID